MDLEAGPPGRGRSTAPDPDDLVELRDRVAQAQALLGAGSQADDLVALVADLETAYEELRVSSEEVRVQQEQIAGLMNNRAGLRLGHDRMMAVLPVATLTTSGEGVIRSVNAASLGLTGLGISRLLGKPIQTLFPVGERPALRRLLSRHARDSLGFRHRTVLVHASGEQVDVEVTAIAVPGVHDEVAWMVLDPRATTAGDQDAASGSLPTPASGLPHVLSQLAGLPSDATGLQQLIGAASRLCHDALGPDVEITVTVGDPTAPTALASSSSLAQLLDGLQITYTDGPCVDAFRRRETIITADVRHDPRWTTLAPHLPDGVGMVVAVPLISGDTLAGALNVYGTRVGVDDRVVAASEILAATLAAILYEFDLRAELSEAAEGFQRAISTRAVIDQAKGMIMAERRCTADEAFEHLKMLSSTQELKLRVVAENLVNRISQP